MSFKAVKGQTLYRIMSGCCCLVSDHYRFIPFCQALTAALRLLLCMGMFTRNHTMPRVTELINGSYDAGVLGGVQSTEPFRKAMGVRTLPQDRKKNGANVLSSIQLAHMLFP